MAASEKVCTCTTNFWKYSKGRAGSDELTFCHPENTRDGGITPMCFTSTDADVRCVSASRC